MTGHFVVYALDRPEAAGLRMRVRDEHRVHLRAARPDCRCVIGGPLMDDAGRTMIGTMLVFEATDRAAVERFMADDPYLRNGLFGRMEIRPWRWGLGRNDSTAEPGAAGGMGLAGCSAGATR